MTCNVALIPAWDGTNGHYGPPDDIKESVMSAPAYIAITGKTQGNIT